MTSNINTNGVDLDAVLAPRGTTPKLSQNFNIQVAGSDISNRYADQYYGMPSAATTNYTSRGTDIGPSFARYGTIGNPLYMWGLGTSGQLGDGTDISKSSPVLIGVNRSWSLIKQGSAHVLALRSDNILFVWGDNSINQCAQSFNSSLNVVGTSSWTSISVGTNMTVAIRSNGALFTWGTNIAGQLGDGTTIARSSPVQIGTSSWTSVSSGQNYTTGLLY